MDTSTVLLEQKLQNADNDIKDGYIAEAVKKLEEILLEDPSFGKAYNHLGFIHETRFKEYEKAEKFYALGLQHAPTYPAIYFNYAVLLSTLGKNEELERLLNKALTVDGVDKGSIYNEFGIMYEKMGNLDKAIESYKQFGMLTLSQDQLTKAKQGIDRCQSKKEMFG